MNVLKVVEACGAGVGRHVRELSESLVAEGHRVTIVYSTQRTDEAFRQFVAERTGEICFVPFSVQRGPSPVSDLQALFRLLRLIRHKGPFDVVHGHSSKGGALARIAGRLCGVPTVYTPHSMILSSPKISQPEYFIYLWVERVLGHLATSVLITVSEDERDFVIKLNVTPRGRVAVIENGIADEDFSYPLEEVVNEETMQKPLTFGSTMRFSTQKAPHHLVEAFMRVSRALPEVPMQLVIVGDGELFTDVERQVEECGLKDHVRLPGWSMNPKRVLRTFDIFVVSSFYESGLSYSTMEAMAAGLPILSTEVFGARRTLAKIPGNVLVPTGDPSAIADGMKRMATCADFGSVRQSLQKIGQANREYVRNNFRQSEITRRTAELYRKLSRYESSTG